MTWRAIAAPIIQSTIHYVGRTAPTKVIRKALREAYPFGQRKCWPYKVWCDEIHRQLGRRSRDTRTIDMFE